MATRTAAPTHTFRSAWRGLACALLCGAIGCTASGSEIQPPRDQLAYPTGLKVSPDGKVLFVVNANSVLQYDSGSLDVVDLGRVQSVIDPWLGYLGQVTPAMDCKSFASGLPSMAPAPPDGVGKLSCTCDPNNPETLQCDEAYFVNPNAGVRVGNFATDISVQDFQNGKQRVFVPTRGDPSIAWADFDGTNLHCTAGSDPYSLCDDAHRLTLLYNNPDLPALPNEPFSVFSDVVREVDAMGNPVAPTHGFAMVTHLADGAVTLIDAPADGEVQITDILTGVAGDSSLTPGTTSIAPRLMPPSPPPPPPAPGEGVPELVPETLYVSSNTNNQVQLFSIGMRNGSAGYLLRDTFFVLDQVGTMAGSSTDSRAIRFSADGNRLYLVNRSPPSLQVYDTSIPTGSATPSNTLLGSSDLCRDGSAAVVAGARINADHTTDSTDERVYVTCFTDGQIYVVNPFGQSQVEDIISVGRGPYAVDVYPNQDPTQSQPVPAPPKYLFVSNFLEDTIAVIDITPSSSPSPHPSTHDRVVLRIGTPRVP